VSVVLYQHIRRCEKRIRESQAIGTNPVVVSDLISEYNPPSYGAQSSRSSSAHESSTTDTGVIESTSSRNNGLHSDSFDGSMPMFSGGVINSLLSGLQLSLEKVFDEEHFVSPQYKYSFVRVPMMHPLTYYRMEKLNCKTHIPSVEEIFRFCKNLFNRAQLSAECTIVCLIYIERLMERAHIPLLGSSWKPIVLCGLLLASKVRRIEQRNTPITRKIACMISSYPPPGINRKKLLCLVGGFYSYVHMNT
jgi:hypothetical protein